MEGKNLLESIKNMGKSTRYLIIAGVATLLIAILVFALFSPSGDTTFSAETSLKEVLEISDLSTAEYTYNSIVEVKNDKDDTKYHVAYKGTVKVGINFENIQFDETEENITIIIPSVEIQDVSVNTDFDYIFTKDKYNNETIYAEAYNKCIEDLTKKAKNNETLLSTARDSAKDTVEALLRPFKSQLTDGQKFVVVFANEK